MSCVILSSVLAVYYTLKLLQDSSNMYCHEDVKVYLICENC